MPAEITITLNVNGRDHRVATVPWRSLNEVLREDLHLTGTKVNCQLGECGVCTVLCDGRAVHSCLMLAVHAAGHRITTIEGLARDGVLHPVQQAFVDHYALQCGFCAPGMILSAVALLGENPEPTEEEIRRAIAGNLCRCTGYHQIVEAIQAASKTLRMAGAPGS